MDLWIKTQSGDLIKPNNIKVGSVIYPYIWVFTRLEGNSVCLGEYETEERAKEVLDEIQKYIMTLNPIFYIMPKE